MKLPDKIQVGSITYSVSYTDMIGDNPNQTGHIDFHNAEILINRKTHEDIQRLTFFHEILHAVFMTQGFNIDDEVRVDERFVEATSHILDQVVGQLVK